MISSSRFGNIRAAPQRLGHLIAALAVLLTAPPAAAIPNSIIGPLARTASPLDGRNFDPLVFATSNWQDPTRLPGDWKPEGNVGTSEISHLLARPKILGHDLVLLRRFTRAGKLESLEATFIDAGSYFGYVGTPADPARARAALARKQEEFAESFKLTRENVRNALILLTGEDSPRVRKTGRGRTLRAEAEEWQLGELSLRLLIGENRLIRLLIRPTALPAGSWLDSSFQENPRDRLRDLEKLVHSAPDGTISLRGLKPIPQGYQPYCGLNSLAMVARHLGLHLDEDWLACAGNFQNTGSAAGSNMLRLYQAVASEAGLRLDRSSSLDSAGLRRAIDAGLPVVVWRRFSADRNALHDAFIRDFLTDPELTLPDPTNPAEQATWPDRSAPLHASVIIGYHPERKEVLFLESWSSRSAPRRMRIEELAATCYLSFIFKP